MHVASYDVSCELQKLSCEVKSKVASYKSISASNKSQYQGMAMTQLYHGVNLYHFLAHTSSAVVSSSPTKVECHSMTIPSTIQN